MIECSVCPAEESSEAPPAATKDEVSPVDEEGRNYNIFLWDTRYGSNNKLKA